MFTLGIVDHKFSDFITFKGLDETFKGLKILDEWSVRGGCYVDVFCYSCKCVGLVSP